jgi:hypothetical protein
MKPAKYLVLTMGLFGVTHTANDSLKKALKKARVSTHDDNRDFAIYTARDGKIVRINRAGR